MDCVCLYSSALPQYFAITHCKIMVSYCFIFLVTLLASYFNVDTNSQVLKHLIVFLKHVDTVLNYSILCLNFLKILTGSTWGSESWLKINEMLKQHCLMNTIKKLKSLTTKVTQCKKKITWQQNVAKICPFKSVITGIS